jgi:serine/threonine protein kinase
MPLPAGTRLGPYEIVSPLGAGGMGEVYKARDTRLDRVVAIKVLSGLRSTNPQARERFDREAKAISSLSNPHICSLYDLGQQDGTDYLVMECLQGEMLASRVTKGRLAHDQVLQYAIQIADALATAHHHGVIHRDLKPGNIMLTKTGAKVLDFGLAKVRATEAHGVPVATQTMPLTSDGIILGTLQYMAPEQLEGKEADTRSDIFSFGLVLYEMLTGKRAFEGSSPASVIAAIMESPAPSVATVAPPALDRLLQRCLKKDPDDRWQCMRDPRAELEWIRAAPGEAASVAAPRHRMLPWVAAAVAVVVAFLIWIRGSSPAAIAPIELTFSIPPPSGKVLSELGGLNIDRILPDGSKILFRVPGQYYVRRLNSLEGEILPKWIWGGDSFWAPDSQSIAFPLLTGTLMKMRIPNGAPELIAYTVHAGRAGSWGESGIILLAGADAGLYSVPASGGTALPVEVPGLKGGAYYYPEFLPDGENFLSDLFPLISRKRRSISRPSRVDKLSIRRYC